MRIVLALIVSVFMAVSCFAQQSPSSQETPTENPKQAATKKKVGLNENLISPLLSAHTFFIIPMLTKHTNDLDHPHLPSELFIENNAGSEESRLP